MIYDSINTDALGIYLTGAASNVGISIADVAALAPPFVIGPADESTPADSLGGYVSITRAHSLGFIVEGDLNLKILYASGENGQGFGFVESVDGSSVRWTAPGGIEGAAVAINSGETKVLESGNSEGEKYIVVERVTADSLTGSATLKLVSIFNNAIGSSNVSSTERTSGVVKLRCIALTNQYMLSDIENMKVWLGNPSLGTQADSDGATFLPASGAGTIGSGASDFSDWLAAGFCEIYSSGDALKEVVFYSSRTGTILTVDAAGRARLKTTTAAGAGTDYYIPVDGIIIAAESPTNGAFTTLTDENDTAAVSGLTWNHGVSAAAGINIGVISPGVFEGIWIWSETYPGKPASAAMDNKIFYSYTVGSGPSQITVTGQLTGRYRLAQTIFLKYELYRGIDADPDFTAAPLATFLSFPANVYIGGSGAGEYRFVLRERNDYNLVSQNIDQWIIHLDSSENEIQTPPASPGNIKASPAAGGDCLVEAEYDYDPDADNIATDWVIYWTKDGTAPDPAVDTPVVVSMKKIFGASARLKQTVTTGASSGDTLKIMVRTRITGTPNTDSGNTDIYSTTASTTGPQKPAGGIFYGQSAEAN